jgi:hypothetical protein
MKLKHSLDVKFLCSGHVYTRYIERNGTDDKLVLAAIRAVERSKQLPSAKPAIEGPCRLPWKNCDDARFLF